MSLGVLSSFFKLNIMTINNWIEAPFVGLKNYFSVFSPGFGFLENFVSSFSYTIVFVVLAQISCYVLAWGQRSCSTPAPSAVRILCGALTVPLHPSGSSIDHQLAIHVQL